MNRRPLDPQECFRKGAACRNASWPRSTQCPGELTKAAGSRRERNALPYPLPSLNMPKPIRLCPLAGSNTTGSSELRLGRAGSTCGPVRARSDCCNRPRQVLTASPGVTAGRRPRSRPPLLRKVISGHFSGRRSPAYRRLGALWLMGGSPWLSAQNDRFWPLAAAPGAKASGWADAFA